MQAETSAPGRGVRIEARDLSRHFGAHVALDRVTLEIERGEVFGLLGANGAGKTTFIRLATGYLLPSSGEIRVDGFSPSVDPDAVHSRLGFVAETEHQVVDHLNGHLQSLPESDARSRLIVQQMREDEGHHADIALEAGGARLPGPVRRLMALTSKLMTRTAYYV